MKTTRFAQESAAQAQAEARDKAVKATILEALKKAKEHLEHCGYGDRWERECAFAVGLPELLDTAIEEASK